MIPSSLATRNLLPPKSFVLLKTMPEGAPGCPGVTDGIITGGIRVLPVVSYTVLEPEWLAAIQTGPPGNLARPHAFNKLASIRAAPKPAVSATRLVWPILNC